MLYLSAIAVFGGPPDTIKVPVRLGLQPNGFDSVLFKIEWPSSAFTVSRPSGPFFKPWRGEPWEHFTIEVDGEPLLQQRIPSVYPGGSVTFRKEID